MRESTFFQESRNYNAKGWRTHIEIETRKKTRTSRRVEKSSSRKRKGTIFPSKRKNSLSSRKKKDTSATTTKARLVAGAWRRKKDSLHQRKGGECLAELEEKIRLRRRGKGGGNSSRGDLSPPLTGAERERGEAKHRYNRKQEKGREKGPFQEEENVPSRRRGLRYQTLGFSTNTLLPEDENVGFVTQQNVVEALFTKATEARKGPKKENGRMPRPLKESPPFREGETA